MNSIHFSKYPYIFSSLEVAASFLPVSAVSDPFIEIHFIQNIESGTDTSSTSNLKLIVNYFCFVNNRLLHRLTTSFTDYSLDRVLHRLTTSLTEDSLDRLLPWQKFHRQKIPMKNYSLKSLHPSQTTALDILLPWQTTPLTYYSLDILLPWRTSFLTDYPIDYP